MIRRSRNFPLQPSVFIVFLDVPTAACGINCDVCRLRKPCGGCVPGNDERAEERLKEIERMMGSPCPALNCAIKKKIDFCLNCSDFPCNVHYKWEIPYSKKLLDLIEKFKKDFDIK